LKVISVVPVRVDALDRARRLVGCAHDEDKHRRIRRPGRRRRDAIDVVAARQWHADQAAAIDVPNNQALVRFLVLDLWLVVLDRRDEFPIGRQGYGGEDVQRLVSGARLGAAGAEHTNGEEDA